MTKRERCFDWGCAWIAIAALSPTTMAAEPSTTVAQASAPDAQAKPAERPIVLPQIEITGAYKQAPKTELSNDPAANPASITVLDYPERDRRNTRDYADLLKPLTGVAANSFDQGGVGYGFTMRGFSERSNGGNVAYYVDGVPINAPGHQSSNGYGDLNPLLPELIGRLVLTRGPFDVRAGAFGLAGSAQYFSDDAPSSGATLNGGSYGFGRALAVYSFNAGALTGYGSAVASKASGYRDNSGFDQYNTFNKVLFPMLDGVASVRAQAYKSDFGAPTYLRKNFIENGTLSPRAAVNSTDGGNTELQNLVFNYKQSGDQPFTANAYVVHSDHDRYATRTFTVPINPNTAGQFLTHDDRVFFGGSIDKYMRWSFAGGMGADLLIGAGVRADNVASGQFSTIARRPTALVADTDFTLVNPFGYVQANFKPVSWVKLTGGLRYDHLSFDITDRSKPLVPVNVSPKLGVLQPKAGISVSPFSGFDIFANYGQGFRPPSPIGDQLLRNPNLEAAKLATQELGIQYKSADGKWQLQGDIYRTTLSNELLGRPAPLSPLSLGPSKRDGFDVEARTRAFQEGRRTLWVYASYSKVDGKLINQASGTKIPDIAEFFVKYGFDLAMPVGGDASPHLMNASIAQVWEGPKPLDAINTPAFRSKTFSRIDAKFTYTNRNWKDFSAFVGVIAYPDRTLEETAFLFSGNVGVSPKPRLTIQGGVFIPF